MANDTLYQDISAYTSELKLNLEATSLTVNNPKDYKCNLTFGGLGINTPDLFKLPTPTPLNFKLFEKFENTANHISDINSIIIGMIQDLECCELADKYNSYILPLFMWVIGDAGDKYFHPNQYQSSRKTDGLLPIIIKIVELIMKVYEPIKAITCVIRPVPGNPWLKQGGMDFFRPLYNFVSEFEFVISTILDGDYVDIINDPLKHFRDQMLECRGKNTGRMNLVDENDLMDDTVIRLKEDIASLLKNTAAKVNLTSLTPPAHSEKYYALQNELTEYIKSKTSDKINNISDLSKLADRRIQIKEYETSLTRYNSDLVENQSLFNQSSDQIEKEKLATKIDWLKSTIASTQTAINDLQMEADVLEKAVSDYSSQDTNIADIQKQLAKEEAIFKYQQSIYDTYMSNASKVKLDSFKDCTLVSKLLASERESRGSACSCLFSLLDIFVPIPETIPIASWGEVESKLYGRLAFTSKDLSEYRNKKYTLIDRYNIEDKFPGSPTFLYDSTFRNKWTGVDPEDILVPTTQIKAKVYYKRMDDAKTITEAFAISEELLNQRKALKKLYIKKDLLIKAELDQVVNFLRTLRQQKLTKVTDIKTLKQLYPTSDFVKTQNKLKQDLALIDDLLKYGSAAYYTIDSVIAELSSLGIDISDNLKNTLSVMDSYEVAIKKIDKVILLNTRTFIVLSKDTPPCDCNIICRILQYLVNLIVSVIQGVIDRIVNMLINAVMTKEIAYIIKFIKAKLQCAIDIAAIPDNFKKITKRANAFIEDMQMKLEYANEPYFCNPKNLVSQFPYIANLDNNDNIVSQLINYTNKDVNDYGEQFIDPTTGTDNSVYEPVFQIPNVAGSDITFDSNTFNNNFMVIKNVTPQKQYESRNIPTLFFDCNVVDVNLRPVFDIYTEKIPDTWSLYFSFSLTADKLNNTVNFPLTTTIKSTKQTISEIVQTELEADLVTVDSYYEDINVNSIIDQAKTLAETSIPDIYKKEVEKCSTDQVYATGDELEPCGYISLEIVGCELLNSTVNDKYINFHATTTAVYTSLIDARADRYNIPIKVRVKRIFDERSKLIVQDYKDEIVSVVLLLDFYDSYNGFRDDATYTKKPYFDANLFYGRYPYYEIGYKSNDGIFHLTIGDEVLETDLLDNETLIKLCDIAIKSKYAIDINKYKPTEEQIAKRKETIEDAWKNTGTCQLDDDPKSVVDNSREATKTVLDFIETINISLENPGEWKVTNSDVNPNSTDIPDILSTEIVTDFGIPLLELNKEEDICIQIIQTPYLENGAQVLKPMVNISNFNFLSNTLNFNDENNLQMIIEPDVTYFISISFDGTKYVFTLIDENKKIASLIKLKMQNTVLFPSRFGRLSNEQLKDQTFCGTLFDIGIANTVIDPILYYKYSMLNFNPKTEIFIDFENNVFNKFYSTSDLPLNDLKYNPLTDEVKSFIEQEYLKLNLDRALPYFIYNKYITAQSMTDNILVEGNNFKYALKESFLTNFFCKDSIKNKTFTISFWFKPISNDLIQTDENRMVLLSDTKFGNSLYYNFSEQQFYFIQDNQFQSKIIQPLLINTWYEMVIRFDHLINRFTIDIASENENKLITIYSKSLNNQFNFNLISMFAEFDFGLKDFTNYFPCLIGNLVMDFKYLTNDKLNEDFQLQKICFKGL